MKLTTQQKLAVFKELEENLSLGLVMTLDIYQDIVSKMSEENKDKFKDILRKFAKEAELIFNDTLVEYLEQKERQFKTAIDSMNREITSLAVTVKKGDPGPQGVPGKTPTISELNSLIKPLIPEVKNGKTPSKRELIGLIRPLIPEVKNGEPGKPGKNGSPDKPSDITKKLNTTKESVDIDVIKGLSKILIRFEKAIRERRGIAKPGGGMGAPQHELFDVSSATTTISTTYKIGARGNSIWLYYNGQHFVKGTHYTVGSDQKTITFLISLQDNTKIAIDYIRT